MNVERPTPNSARIVRDYPVESGGLLAAAHRAVESLPRWSVEGSEAGEIRAVRATRLLRFKDDVSIRVMEHEGGARAEFESVSRIGKGDLGQNPRNLRELIQKLERELPSA